MGSEYRVVWPGVVTVLGGSLVALLAACGGLPKRGSDTARVAIGPPRVTSRERYIADRSNDLAWLRQQLEPAALKEYEQGTQASVASFVSDLGALGIKVRADFTGPLTAPGGGEQPGSGATAANATGGEGVGEADDQGRPEPLDPEKYAADPASASLTQFHKLTGDQIEALVKATRPDISATPSERLDDRLAFRDSVRSAIRQRDLDDTHDLYGNTLHELTLDLSLVPGRDAGSPYVVLLTARPADKPACLGDDAREALAAALHREAIHETARRGDVITRGHDAGDTLTWYAGLETWPIHLDHRSRVDAAAEQLTVIIEAAEQACRLSFHLNGADDAARLSHAHQIADAIVQLPDFRGEDRARVAKRLMELRRKRECPLPTHLGSLRSIRDRMAALRAEARAGVLHGTPVSAAGPQIAADRALLRRIVEELGGEFEELHLIDAVLRVRSRLPAEADPIDDPSPLQLHRTFLQPLSEERQFTALNHSAEALRVAAALPRPRSLAELLRGGSEKFSEDMNRLLDEKPDAGRVRSWQLELAAVSVARMIQDRSENWLAVRCDNPVVEATITTDRQIGRTILSALPRFDPPAERVPGPLLARMCERQKQSPVRIIGVAPTEQVQQLGVDLSSLVGHAIDADIAAILGSHVAGGARMQRLREELLRISQLERQPIIVGFVGATDADSSAQTFGWVLGPRFEARQPGFNLLSPGGVEEWERQIAVHHPVTATVVCPAWVDSVTLEARAYRIGAYGEWIQVPLSVSDDGVVCRDVPCGASGKGEPPRRIRVSLPVDGDAFARWVLYGNDRRAGEPSVHPPTRIVDAETGEYKIDWALKAGTKGSMTIRGRHLWRNPEVYVGGVKAGRVEVMADLNGLFVTFDAMPLPPGRHTLQVATSAGAVEIPDAVEVVRGESPLPKAKLKDTAAVVFDKKATLVLTLDRELTDFGSFYLRVRRRDEVAHVAEVSDPGAFHLKEGKELSVDIAFKNDVTTGAYEVDLFLLRTLRSDPARISSTELVLLVPVKAVTEPAYKGVSAQNMVLFGAGADKKTAIKKGAVITYVFRGLTWADVARFEPGLKDALAKAEFRDEAGAALANLKAAPVPDVADATFTVTAGDDVSFANETFRMTVPGVGVPQSATLKLK